MASLITTVPYDDYNILVKDSEDKANVIELLNAEFPDAECQVLAIKAVLGMLKKDEEVEDEPIEEPTEPAEDETEPNT